MHFPGSGCGAGANESAYDASMGAQCAAEAAEALATATCAVVTGDAYMSEACEAFNESLKPAEDPVPSGNVPLGGACEWDSDCASFEGGSVECFVGECRGSMEVSLGEACTHTCTKGSSGNSSCVGSSPEDGIARNCYKDEGGYCASEDKICTPLKTEGEGCSKAAGTTSKPGTYGCGEGLYCGPEATCIPRATIGDSCEMAMCESGTYCVEETTCVALKADGDSCTENQECVGGYCVDDTRCGSFGTEMFCIFFNGMIGE